MTAMHYSIEQLIQTKLKSPIVTPSRQKSATAVALGLWEPAKHAAPVTFALQPSAPVYEYPNYTLEHSIHNPANAGLERPLCPLVETTNIPEGFVNIHLGSEKDHAQTSDHVFPVNRELLGQYCGHFRQDTENNPTSHTFHLQAPAQDSYDIKEDALTLLFPIFNTWLHEGGALVTRDGTAVRHLNLLKLCRLYVFGILLEAPLFGNAVMDCIKRKRQVFNVFDFSGIEDAVMYVYGLPYINLRAAVVDFVVVNSGPWIVAAFEWPSIAKKDMLDALFFACKEKIERDLVEDRCRHHIHGVGETCKWKQ